MFLDNYPRMYICFRTFPITYVRCWIKFDFGKIRLNFDARTYVRYWKLSKNLRAILDKSVNICTLLDKLIILNILHYINLQFSTNEQHGRDQE